MIQWALIASLGLATASLVDQRRVDSAAVKSRLAAQTDRVDKAAICSNKQARYDTRRRCSKHMGQKEVQRGRRGDHGVMRVHRDRSEQVMGTIEVSAADQPRRVGAVRIRKILL